MASKSSRSRPKAGTRRPTSEDEAGAADVPKYRGHRIAAPNSKTYSVSRARSTLSVLRWRRWPTKPRISSSATVLDPSLVIFDACVLYPFHLRNIVEQIAADRLVDARWKDEIYDEWIRNLVAG